MVKDYYEILGVSKTASDEELKLAYRRLAIQYHPDKNPNNNASEERFKEIAGAYQALDTTEKRIKYDMASNGGTHQEIRDAFHDLINNMYGRGFGVKMFNPTIKTQVLLTLEEAILGSKRTVQLVFDNEPAQTINLEIPRGARSNDVITYKGVGSNKIKNVPRGELQAHIIVAEDPKFKLINDNDLLCIVQISFWQAILGGTVGFNGILGNKIQFNIPPKSKFDSTITIIGEGFFNRKLNARGDLLVKVQFEFPDFTDEQLNTIKKWSLL